MTTMTMTDSTLRKKVLQIQHLPPLPVTANQLLEKVADSGVEIDELADIIGQDPGLSARILGLANAAYFGQIRPVTTIREAIIRVLGLNMVKSLALSIAMSGAFESDQCPGFDLENYWLTALGSAALGRMLAMKLPLDIRPDPNTVYLCGLLHNLGALVIAHVFPAECARVYQALQQDPDQDIGALEQEYVGITRTQAAEWVGVRWHMPQFVVRAVSHHADPSYAGPDEVAVLLIGCAARWTASGADCDALARDPVLRDRLQLMPHVLSAIAEKFQVQRDELAALAKLLS